MFVLGILALLQIICLPGLILLLWLRLGEGVIQTGILAFGLSLVCNFLLVVMLTMLHLYKPITLYSVILLEIAIFMGLWLRKKPMPHTVQTVVWVPSYTLALTLVGVGITFAYYGYLFLHSSSVGIFVYRDALLSYNRWALAWAQGMFPQTTWNYPQLLPTNWSLTYLMTQSNIQQFAVVLGALFPLAILLGLFDLSVRHKKIGYSVAIILTGYLFYIYNIRFGALNYATIPCAFLSFCAIYALWTGRSCYVLLGSIFAAGAALTKQAGLPVAILYPLLAWIGLGRQNIKRIKIVWMVTAIIVLLVAPWYLSKSFQMASIDTLSMLELYMASTYTQRLLHASTLIQPLWMVIWLLPLAFGALYDKKYTHLLLLLVLPYCIIWALWFSYDTRNLAVIIPMVGMIAGIGVCRMMAWFRAHLDIRLRYLIGMVAILALLVGWSLNFDRTMLTYRQIDHKVYYLGNKAFNRYLYFQYLKKHDIDGPIVSNMTELQHLPMVGASVILFPFHDPELFQQLLQKDKPRFLVIDLPHLRYAIQYHRQHNVSEIRTITEKTVRNYVEQDILRYIPHYQILYDKDVLFVRIV